MTYRSLIFFAATLLFNTAIAGVLWLQSQSGSFIGEFLFAQCVGCSIALTSALAYVIAPGRRHTVLALGLSLPIGIAVGVSLAFKVTGDGAWSEPGVARTLAICLFFGIIGTTISILAHRIEMEIERRHLVRSEGEKREIEAHLKLLQAQIEPHFLFNTLANVGSLIDSDPRLARHLLDRLNDWLRVALARARSERTTLGDEIALLENYLAILQIRFDERLRWRIDVPDRLRRHPFPPMLLQPLVENAVRHGIEPKIGGGEIGIVANIEGAVLHLDVSDTGVGLGDEERRATKTDQAHQGAGLANVHARLAALFGSDARLALHGNAAGGTTATLTLPLGEEVA